MNSNYALNFVIPQGPTGPAGPQGGLSSYGGRFNNSASTLNLGILTQTQIPLPTTLPNSNTSYATSNSIRVILKSA